MVHPKGVRYHTLALLDKPDAVFVEDSFESLLVFSEGVEVGPAEGSAPQG